MEKYLSLRDYPSSYKKILLHFLHFFNVKISNVKRLHFLFCTSLQNEGSIFLVNKKHFFQLLHT